MTLKRACFFVLSALLLTTEYAQADFFTGRDAFRQGDYETAMKELKPEADKGNTEATTIIAKMYQGGLGVTKDVGKATELFKRAAELGDGEAQYNYGIARALGDGVEQNLAEGLKWLFIAARIGNDKAQTYLKTLQMPPDLTAEAKRAAFRWHRVFEKKQKEKLEAESKKADEEQQERARVEAKKAEESKAEEKKAAPAADAEPAVTPAAASGDEPAAKPAPAGDDGSSSSPPAKAPAASSAGQ